MPGREHRVMRLAWVLPLTAGAAFILGFLLVALKRIGYPFALEWMEGGAVDVVRRILAGQSIYVEPSVEYVPFVYTPLYFYAAAPLSALLGVGFLPLRLLSLAATLGTLAALFVLIRRETGDRVAASLSAALYAATFGASGAWFDLARIDALFVFLFALMLVVLRRPASRATYLVAGALLGLAILTKQTALIAAAPLVVYVTIDRPRLAGWFAAALAVTTVVPSLVLHRLTGGWYLYYVLQLGHDPPDWRRAEQFWGTDLLRPVPIACLAAAGFLWWRARSGRWRDFSFWILLLGGTMFSACLSRSLSGGYLNVLMPLHLALAALFGLAVHALRSAGAEMSATQPAAVAAPVLLALAGAAACLIQFGLLVYNPRDCVPAARDLAAGRNLVSALHRVDGDILIPLHGYLAGMAGKRIYLQGSPCLDTLRVGIGPVRNRLIASIGDALRERRFRLVILDRSELLEWNRFLPLFGEEMDRAYVPAGSVFKEPDSFWTMAGARTRPDDVRVPRPRPGSPDGADRPAP